MGGRGGEGRRAGGHRSMQHQMTSFFPARRRCLHMREPYGGT